MKIKTISGVTLFLLIASFATAQIPCGPTISPLPTLFVNWSQFRYDTQHTACNPYETILSSKTVGNLALDWTYPAGAHVFQDPAVANGLVYFSSDYPDNTLYAVNAATGALVWKYVGAGQTYFSAPVVVNNIVYVGALHQSAVYAFKASTGEFLWQYATAWVVESAPTVANGVLYIGDGNGTLYALNAATGTLLWTYAVPSDEIVSSPTVANGVIYFVSVYPIYPNWSTTLYALNASSQQVMWHYKWSDLIGGTPVAGPGAVYFNSTAFDANTGGILWTSPTYFNSLPALANGVLYVGSDDNAVYALNANTGTVRWRFGTGNSVYSSPSVANGVVYAESNDGNLYALDASTGSMLWQYAVSPISASSPAIANGKVYIGSENATLYAFHLPGQ